MNKSLLQYVFYVIGKIIYAALLQCKYYVNNMALQLASIKTMSNEFFKAIAMYAFKS